MSSSCLNNKETNKKDHLETKGVGMAVAEEQGWLMIAQCHSLPSHHPYLNLLGKSTYTDSVCGAVLSSQLLMSVCPCATANSASLCVYEIYSHLPCSCWLWSTGFSWQWGSPCTRNRVWVCCPVQLQCGFYSCGPQYTHMPDQWQMVWGCPDMST